MKAVESGVDRSDARRVFPLVVLGLAIAAGFVLARIIDWRGYAHPRD